MVGCISHFMEVLVVRRSGAPTIVTGCLPHAGHRASRVGHTVQEEALSSAARVSGTCGCHRGGDADAVVAARPSLSASGVSHSL